MIKTRNAPRVPGGHKPGIRSRDLLIWWAPVVVWMAAIYYVSAQNTWTTIGGPPPFLVLRKAGHVFEYTVLALLLGRALYSTWRARGDALTRALLQRVWVVGVAISAVYACTDEVHQFFVPKRGFHVGDIAIDALSATAALGIWYIFGNRARAGAHPIGTPEKR